MNQRRLGAGALCLAMVGGVGLLAAPTASAAATTVSTGFESATDGWYGRGGAKIALSTAEAHTGSSSLEVTGRTQSWEGPGLDLDAAVPAGTYDLSAWVKLPAGSGSDKATMTVAHGGQYTTVGAYQTPVTDSGWTKVGGSFTVTAGTDFELYLETTDVTRPFLVDDVLITGDVVAPTAPVALPALTTDFESGTQGWGPRGDATVATTTTDAHGGTTSLLATNRLQSWQGPAVDITKNLAVGQTVQVSVWAKLAPGQGSAALKLSVQRDKGTATSYEGVAGASATVTDSAWTQLKGTYTLGAAIDKAQLYVEGDAGKSFLIDDASLAVVQETPIQDVPALKDVLGAAGIEHVSTAIDQRETVGRPSQLFLKHFNTFTPENDGKPESTEPTKGTFTFANLDHLLDYADANHVQVYGHVLFWHSQTPAWVFQDGTGRQLTNSPADQQVLLGNMEEHVKGIADHLEARYPNGNSPIWAWDVANETINDGPDGNAFDMRNSPYYQILGQQWVADGFRIAAKYFPDQKLFLNDYNTEMPDKRADYLGLIGSLIKDGVRLDGVSHQAHVDFGRPVQWLDESLTAVEQLSASTGHPLMQAISELDVSDSADAPAADVGGSGNPVRATSDDAAAGAEVGYYYRNLTAVLEKHAASLQSVTFWDIDNARSWLRTWPTARPWEQPTPFDDDLQVTPAYWGIVDPSRLPTRPADFLVPRIAAHADVAASSTSTAGAKVTYALPEAGDNVDGTLTPVCTPPSGSLFPIGTTTVTCTATDKAGNKAKPVTFKVVVTAPPTTTVLYSQIDNGSVVRANVKQNVQVVVQFGNKGKGVLVGRSFAYSCTQRSGPAMTLALAPGSAQQVTNRDYPAGQNANFQLRGNPTQVGTATFDCTLTMTDGFGAKVTSTNTVTIDVRK
jgi:GH35 family endo-1,4-beta-xylanase